MGSNAAIRVRKQCPAADLERQRFKKDIINVIRDES